MSEKIAIIGLGYVGLPVALAFAQKYENTIGFDIRDYRVKELQEGFDSTGEVEKETLKKTNLTLTHELNDLKDINIYIVTVPTPIDQNKQPDLTPVKTACEMVGKVINKDDIIVFESTVYPGVTEEICGPILEESSGLKASQDFFLGYSPERINPGDKKNTLENITKVVAGDNKETLERLTKLYGSIIKAGIHKASSIKVAEAAKVIENTQRDLNIALVNELALIFDRLDIRTEDVLQAAGTKWNFLPFRPGLVGGHCIGVDPFYLTTKAEQAGYHPQVILAGRRINDGMGSYIAHRTIKLLIETHKPVRSANVLILGLTFKENVRDVRNSKVPDIVKELKEFGITPSVHDPIAEPSLVDKEYGITLCNLEDIKEIDAIILAVPHDAYKNGTVSKLINEKMNKQGVIVDIKSQLKPDDFPDHLYWSL